MKKIKKIISLILLTLTFTLLVPQMPTIPNGIVEANAATVKLNKNKATLCKGKTLQLKVSGTKKKIAWKSSNKKVASVSSKGKVKAKKEGNAIITAKIGKKKLKCSIKVFFPKFASSILNITIGEQKKLKISNQIGNVTWETSNYKIASVSSDGNITGKGYGKCYIYAITNGNKLSCEVNVSVADPICFPNNGQKIYDVTINEFNAEFVSYQLFDDYSQKIEDDLYYFPYTYRIKIIGHTDMPSSTISLGFCMLCDGKFSNIPGNISASATSDKNGDFVIDKNIKFNTYGERIYIHRVSIN